MHMSDTKKCIDFLSHQEKTFLLAGRFVDIIRGLASYGDLAFPDPETPTSPYMSVTNKRDRYEADGEPESQEWQSQPTFDTPPPDIAPHLAQNTNRTVPHTAPCLQDLPYNTAALGQTSGWIDYEHHSATDPRQQHTILPLNFDSMHGDSLYGTAATTDPYPPQWIDMTLPYGSAQNSGFFEGDTLWSSVPTGFQSDEWGNLIDELSYTSSAS